MSHYIDENFVQKVQHIINYRFRDLGLLKTFLTHPSLCNSAGLNYERLEFLGDAILGMIISEMLYRFFPNDNEGALTKKKTALVCGRTVVKVAQSIHLGELMFMSNGELASGGKENPSNLENGVEALIGAMYLDGGIEAARSFIVQHWKTPTELMITPPQDAKTALQEWAQGKGFAAPVYKLLSKSGVEHSPIFTVLLTLGTHGSVVGTGGNKKAAEQEAAKLMLEKVKEDSQRS